MTTEPKICACATLDAAYACVKRGPRGCQGEVPVLTYFLFTACFPAPSTLIYAQSSSRNCSVFAVDICSSTYENNVWFLISTKS